MGSRMLQRSKRGNREGATECATKLNAVEYIILCASECTVKSQDRPMVVMKHGQASESAHGWLVVKKFD